MSLVYLQFCPANFFYLLYKKILELAFIIGNNPIELNL